MATTTSYSTIFGDWAWIFLTYPEFYGIKIICLENSWRSIVKKVTEIELKHPSGCHQIFGCANSIAWCFSWYWPNRSPCVHLLVVLMWTHVGPGERWRSIKVARWRIFDGFLTDLSFNRSRVSRNMEPIEPFSEISEFEHSKHKFTSFYRSVPIPSIQGWIVLIWLFPVSKFFHCLRVNPFRSNFSTLRFLLKYLIGQNFGGKKCQKSDLLPIILSAKRFFCLEFLNP